MFSKKIERRFRQTLMEILSDSDTVDTALKKIAALKTFTVKKVSDLPTNRISIIWTRKDIENFNRQVPRARRYTFNLAWRKRTPSYFLIVGPKTFLSYYEIMVEDETY